MMATLALAVLVLAICNALLFAIILRSTHAPAHTSSLARFHIGCARLEVASASLVMQGWERHSGMPQRRPRGARVVEQSHSTLSGNSRSLKQAEATNGAEPAANRDDGEEQMKLRAELRSGAETGASYEYLDHTADVQLHAWGETLEQAFANTALAMLNYMTPLAELRIDESCSRSVSVEGHDMHTLLFAFLDELLFLFSTELLVFKHIQVMSLDRAAWRLEATGQGERFDRRRHASGTEVKAITYSAMQVTERTAAGDAEVFVIVDI